MQRDLEFPHKLNTSPRRKEEKGVKKTEMRGDVG